MAETFWVIDIGQTWAAAVPVEVDDGEDEASAVESLVGQDFWEEVAISDSCEGVYWVADNPHGLNPLAIRLRWVLVREAETLEGITPPKALEEVADG